MPRATFRELSPRQLAQLAVTREWLGNGAINLFGRPFAGKDSRGLEIAHYLDDAPLISGGSILRAANSFTNTKSHMDDGHFHNTDSYLSTITPFFSQREYNGRPLVLSSVGRKDGEQVHIFKALADAGHRLMAIILLELSEAESKERLEKIRNGHAHNRGERADDTHAALEIRFKDFRDSTGNVLADYEAMGVPVIRVDATQQPFQVTSDILHALYVRAADELPGSITAS